jgi:hypothetical protein
MSFKVEPRFQDARDVTHVSVARTAAVGLKPLPWPFLTVSDVKFKDAESCQLQDQFHTFRARDAASRFLPRSVTFSTSLHLTWTNREAASMIKI